MKLRYIFAVGIPVFVILTALSFYFYWQDNHKMLAEVETAQIDAAIAFAREQDQMACLNHVIQQSRDCREAHCTVGLKVFLTHCVKHATASTKLCEGVPDAQDYFAKVSWSVSICRKAKVRNGNCSNIVNEVPVLCSARSSG
ncbi:hypothetical protein DS2_02003 [Catenovulum agarivorans DS-2]|uniref:Uncharacterized protein n=1 Tax=Catenovulum agarivorans DS-2 TaxID=1328313 RepID=W7QW04_9ALTE|nr:hypothetical protein [Catenovulum agarivorans]EWH11918.1 hypothetical protein DS2_02003 [Catenovulum agarivorans DS-2]